MADNHWQLSGSKAGGDSVIFAPHLTSPRGTRCNVSQTHAARFLRQQSRVLRGLNTINQKIMSKNKSVSQPSSNLESLRNLTVLTATAMLVASGAGVEAQSTTNTPPASGTVTKLPEEVVKGESEKPTLSSPKYTEPLRNIPQTVTVIPRAIIDEQGATSLRDVLRNVSGISMQAGEGGGGLPGDNLSIRGFSARSAIYVDGARDTGAYSRDPFNLEQIEVAKGPSSSTSGRGATGGSINLVSKSAKQETFYAGTLGMGTDAYKRATLDVNQSLAEAGLESSAFRINGLWHEAGMPGVDVVEEQRWAVAPTYTFGLGTPTRVTLSYFHMEQDNVPWYGIPWVPVNTNPQLSAYSNQAPPVDYGNFYGIRGYDYEEVRNDFVTATVEHDFSESLRLRNMTRYGRTDRSSAITAPRFVDANVSTQLNRQLQRRDIDTEISGNYTDLNIDFDTGPLEHEAVVGLEISREDQDNKNSAQTGNQPTTDLFNPNPNATPVGPMPSNSGDPNHAHADTVAVYVFDTIKLTEQWQVNGGVRFDHVEADYLNTTTDLGRSDDMLSWNSGLVFKPRPNGSIYVGVGTSFDASIDGNTGLGLTGPTALLEPEETRTYEVGTKWDFFNERLSLSTGIFRTEKVDARTTATGGTVTSLDGEQVIDGVEFGISGKITEDWSMLASYTYMESEIKQSAVASDVGAEFGNTPDHSASVWTTYQFPWDMEIGAGAQYVGERGNNNSGSATLRTAPSYVLFDAMAAYHLTKDFTLRLNVYNLADKEYIDRIGGGHFIPGAGRFAMLTASLKF